MRHDERNIIAELDQFLTQRRDHIAETTRLGKRHRFRGHEFNFHADVVSHPQRNVGLYTRKSGGATAIAYLHWTQYEYCIQRKSVAKERRKLLYAMNVIICRSWHASCKRSSWKCLLSSWRMQNGKDKSCNRGSRKLCQLPGSGSWILPADCSQQSRINALWDVRIQAGWHWICCCIWYRFSQSRATAVAGNFCQTELHAGILCRCQWQRSDGPDGQSTGWRCRSHAGLSGGAHFHSIQSSFVWRGSGASWIGSRRSPLLHAGRIRTRSKILRKSVFEYRRQSDQLPARLYRFQ